VAPTSPSNDRPAIQRLQARALGDPTRDAIFRHLAARRRPVDIAELTEHVGLHHNAVRQHLARLVDASLVEETTAAPQGRGRPRLVYTVAPNVDSRWGVVGPYEQLTVLMSEIIRTGDAPVAVGERAGARLGVASDDGTSAPAAPVDLLVEHMARQGFEPTLTRDGDGVDVVLHSCPFETTALVDPDTVCGLHLGIARGNATSRRGLVVDELVRRDPRTAGCVLRCRLDAGPHRDTPTDGRNDR
jgi:predicted ArsR family transcriptional regulator